LSEVLYDGRDLEVLANLPNYHGWIMDGFRRHLRGKAIEFGAGAGAISERLLPCVNSLDLVEPSVNLAATLKDRFADDGSVTVHTSTLEIYLANGHPEFDVAVLVNVLEHIEDDVDALRGLRAQIRKGGSLLMFVPAMPFLFSKLDREFGHFRRYTAFDLEQKVEQAGFQILESRYMDILGIVPWWLLNTVCGKTEFNQSLVTLYDTVGIPVTRLLEKIIRAPVGKNILITARNPE